MLDLIRKYSIRISAAIALLVALIFYSLNLRHKENANVFERAVLTVSAPVVAVVSRIDGFFSSIWENYIYLVNVEKENRQLKEALKVLKTRLIENREAVLDNERLKKLMDLRERLPAPSIAAAVISEDSSPWFRTVTIDRGEEDGIREGMPVVGSAGVVGRVVKTARGSARVLLLTDHASGIAAVVQRSRARGVVKGKVGSICSLEFSQRGDDVRIGDIVLTSGIGGVFPKGLPIGEITMVKKGEYGIFQAVDIRPYVNIYRLEEVLVILQKGNE
ncbi:MAG TPA: rod shape-determining protein MreC [Geobacteraceae bacterium]|nr:rod shape-determining protein MreC [Geobacteraceae bacterium]